MTYKEARVYLDTMSKYGSVLGLDTIRELLQELGNPQEALKFIHIAGTNGKGSVLAYTSTILSEAGYRIGRYVSPTVVSYLERIQIDGDYISEEAFARLMEKLQKAIARIEAAGHTPPTVFEIETAIAFLYFKEQLCDFVVLECGMGGSLDATNIIPAPVCAAFTSISIDHLGILGNTLEEIALSKAGIIKSGCHVVIGPQKPNVLDILTRYAKHLDCPVHIAEPAEITVLREHYTGQSINYKDYQNLVCPLAGRHQIANAITALEIIMTLRQLHYHIPEDALQNGLAKTQWPGRFSVLGKDPLFIIDGAHNEEAAMRLRESLDLYFPEQKWIYIMGVFKDKDYPNIAKHLAPLAAQIHTVNLPNVQRTLPADELADTLKGICSKDTTIYPEASIKASVRNALLQGQRLHLPILAFGSLSYLGELMEHYKHLTKMQEGDLL